MIIAVSESEQHQCAVLEFESGNQLFAWPNIARPLAKAWGYSSDDWIGKEVELSVGYYKDRNGKEKPTIEARPVTPAPAPGKALPLSKDMDDEIPF